MQLDPNLASALHNKSLALKQLHRYEEAQEAAKAALRMALNASNNVQRKAEVLGKLRSNKESHAVRYIISAFFLLLL